MSDRGGILLTAFEPSGESLAVPIIEALRRDQPGRPVFAMGGDRMATAGATLIEPSTVKPVIGPSAVLQVFEHRRRLARLRKWMADHPLSLVIPVDSPAANFGICKVTRQRQPDAKIAHLAAPQLWAWGESRVNKLRRLTDMVLCLFPFEPDWFVQRDVPATFVGHPLMDKANQHARQLTNDQGLAAGPQEPDNAPAASGHPRLALMPGSRDAEVQRNFPTMLKVVEQLRRSFPKLAVTVAAIDQKRADMLRQVAPFGLLPEQMQVRIADADGVFAWADAALVVSGTITLQGAAAGTPMVVSYATNRYVWHALAQWIIRTRTFALPNLIAEADDMGCVVPEFVPNFGDPQPLANALEPLLAGGEHADRQRELFAHIRTRFADRPFVESVMATILPMLGE